MFRRIAVAAACFAAILVPQAAVAGGGGHACFGPQGELAFSDTASNSVAITDNCFVSNVVRIEPGETVKWHNKDPFDHTVTGVANVFGSMDTLMSGDQVGYRFDEEGTFPYYCAFHPGMVGAVVVGDGAGKGVAAAGAIAPDMGDDETTTTSAAAPETQEEGGNIPLFLGIALAVLIGLGGIASLIRNRRRTQPAPQL